jgi:hypothetical protein
LIFYDSNHLLKLLGKFSSVKMIEWGEREHEEEAYFYRNDSSTSMALRECGLLKLFKIQGTRAQMRLLEYLVHMWDVNEKAFQVGVHTLTLDIYDILFLMGLSHRGSRVSFSGRRG